MPLWFWQVVLVPTLVWLTFEPLLRVIREPNPQALTNSKLLDNAA
jgi:hypothetical protein